MQNKQIDISEQYVQQQEQLKELEEGRQIEKIIEGVDREIIKFEFTVIKRITQTQHHFQNLWKYKPDIFVQNRYGSVVPFQHNMTRLPGPPDQPSTHYINAATIHLPFASDYLIQTQGPLESTLFSFWKLVWHYNVTTIVMLCMLSFQDVLQCHQYWPQDKEQSRLYLPSQEDPQIIVVLLQVIQLEQNNHSHVNLFKRVFEVQMLLEDQWHKRQVVQIQFKNWRDNQVPFTNTFHQLDTVFQYVQNQLDKQDQNQNREKTIVHCSAGIGRTGTFICIFDLVQILNEKIKEIKTLEEFTQTKISVFSSLRKIREQRWGMIKTEVSKFLFYKQDQYSFVYEYLKYFLIQAKQKFAEENKQQ